MADGRKGSKRLRPWTIAVAVASVGLVTALATAIANPKPDTSRNQVEQIVVTATPIPHFDKGRPKLHRFGRLEWRGGLVLTSTSKNFGGWSGLVMDPDGRKLLAISDAGSWMLAEVEYDGVRPKGLRQARLGPLLGIGGRVLRRERERDAEDVALLSGTLAAGTVLISFERVHRIARFPVAEGGVGAPNGSVPLPPEARRLTPNRGLESVCILRGGPLKGHVATFAERYPGRSGEHVGWIGPLNGHGWTTLRLKNHGGFDIVSCAGLADGSLLLLERRFRWSEMLAGVRSQLRHIRAEELRPGALIEGQLILEADLGYEIDNLEGLGIHRGPAGETVLTLISDDNFNHWLQRTVLVQFVLHDAPASAVTKGSGR